jgi:hypothetical protein
METSTGRRDFYLRGVLGAGASELLARDLERWNVAFDRTNASVVFPLAQPDAFVTILADKLDARLG